MPLRDCFRRPPACGGLLDWTCPLASGSYFLTYRALLTSGLLRACCVIGPQVGQHTDDLTSKTIWYRMPYMVSRFPINAASTTAGNPMGGLIYITVPSGTVLGNVEVRALARRLRKRLQDI